MILFNVNEKRVVVVTFEIIISGFYFQFFRYFHERRFKRHVNCYISISKREAMYLDDNIYYVKLTI